MKRILAMVLFLVMLLSAAGCGGVPEKEQQLSMIVDLMENVHASDVVPHPDADAGTAAATEFGVQLVKSSMKDGENVLISPLSVLCALAMTANGAEGETLAQMETVLGSNMEQLNEYLCWYMDALPQSERYSLRLANSIWINTAGGFTPSQDFLQVNADYYSADLYSAPFDDATLEALNGWVGEKTNRMIPQVLDKISPDALMYLVNALAFEAQWQTPYEEYQVREGIFIREDGTEQTVEMMYGGESRYLEDELATGFIKQYEDGAYAFAAILPNEGVTVEEYLASLTGEGLRAMLDSAKSIAVRTAIPKFETEYSVELSEILSDMGMELPFNEDLADFSGLGTCAQGNIFISRVLHKTFISVGEQGTRAGAATVVEMAPTSAPMPEEMKEVYLNRPFLYLLIDCESGLPFFIGVMMNVEQ